MLSREEELPIWVEVSTQGLCTMYSIFFHSKWILTAEVFPRCLTFLLHWMGMEETVLGWKSAGYHCIFCFFFFFQRLSVAQAALKPHSEALNHPDCSITTNGFGLQTHLRWVTVLIWIDLLSSTRLLTCIRLMCMCLLILTLAKIFYKDFLFFSKQCLCSRISFKHFHSAFIKVHCFSFVSQSRKHPFLLSTAVVLLLFYFSLDVYNSLILYTFVR